MAAPLSGRRVLEMLAPDAPPALAAAVGFCGRVAADLGADVTRLVASGARPSPADSFLHGGKRSLGHDGAAVELAAWLVADADALVSDGSDAEPSGKPAPRLVQVTIGMGPVAAGALRSEFAVEALSGLLDVVGDPQRAPLRMGGGHQTAYAAGLAAFTALAACLNGSADTGPRRARVSLLDVAVWLNWKGVATASETGRSARRAGGLAEWPVLSCADGHVAVVFRNQEWQRLVQTLRDPALEDDAFATIASRKQNRAALNAILARHFATLTRRDIHAVALQYKLPFGAVWSPAELLDDAQMQARGVFVPVANGAGFRPGLPVGWGGA